MSIWSTIADIGSSISNVFSTAATVADSGLKVYNTYEKSNLERELIASKTAQIEAETNALKSITANKIDEVSEGQSKDTAQDSLINTLISDLQNRTDNVGATQPYVAGSYDPVNQGAQSGVFIIAGIVLYLMMKKGKK